MEIATVVGVVLGVWGTCLSTALAVREFKKGPSLKGWAIGNMVAVAQPSVVAAGLNNGQFINLSLVNRGDIPTTITGLSMMVDANRISRVRKKSLHCWAILSDGLIGGPGLPFRLDTGSEWTGLIRQLDEVTNRPNSAIVEVVFSVTHRDKPIRVRARFHDDKSEK